MQVNLVADLGLAVAEAFLAAHRALTRFDHHPYWDVASAVDCAPEMEGYWRRGRGPGRGRPPARLDKLGKASALPPLVRAWPRPQRLAGGLDADAEPVTTSQCHRAQGIRSSRPGIGSR